MPGCCESVDEPSVCIIYGEFLVCLRRYQLVQEVCAAWIRLMFFVPRGPGTGKAALTRDILYGHRVTYSKAATDGYCEKCYKIDKECTFVGENSYENIIDGTSFTDVENLKLKIQAVYI